MLDCVWIVGSRIWETEGVEVRLVGLPVVHGVVGAMSCPVAAAFCGGVHWIGHGNGEAVDGLGAAILCGRVEEGRRHVDGTWG